MAETLTCPRCGCDEILAVTDVVAVCSQCGTCLAEPDYEPLVGNEDIVAAHDRQRADEAKEQDKSSTPEESKS